jgi:hypothetical protein
MNKIFEIVLTEDTDELENVVTLLEAAMPGEVELHDVLRITTFSENARQLVHSACQNLMDKRNSAHIRTIS